MATVASDVSTRDGIGWEFETFNQELVWEVFREDSGPSPVFMATRHSENLPDLATLRAMTVEAVGDLLASAGHLDEVGWLTKNIAEALLLAARAVYEWEGEEWAVEMDSDGNGLEWADGDSPRVPFAWLNLATDSGSQSVDIYQDDAAFGLSFISPCRRTVALEAQGALRPRRAIPLVTGQITSAEVLYDLTECGARCSGVVSEVVLRGEQELTHFIAAEAYGCDEWHRFDESVVVLTHGDAASTLDWIPPRPKGFPAKRVPDQEADIP